MVGDRGVKLSGGQRQRVALARAFLADAPMLILDEATSALNDESEEAIREAMVRLMKGRTVIAIAHRLSTVRDFDRIVMFQGGEIVQDGPPGELIDVNGHYSDFARRKMTAKRKYHRARQRIGSALRDGRLTDCRCPDVALARQHIDGDVRPRCAEAERTCWHR